MGNSVKKHPYLSHNNHIKHIQLWKKKARRSFRRLSKDSDEIMNGSYYKKCGRYYYEELKLFLYRKTWEEAKQEWYAKTDRKTNYDYWVDSFLSRFPTLTSYYRFWRKFFMSK